MRTMLITCGGRGLGRTTEQKLAAASDRLSEVRACDRGRQRQRVKRRSMQVVLPHMPSATPLDAAMDALALMALDPSIEAAAGQSFGQSQPIALRHPGARAWRAPDR